MIGTGQQHGGSIENAPAVPMDAAGPGDAAGQIVEEEDASRQSSATSAEGLMPQEDVHLREGPGLRDRNNRHRGADRRQAASSSRAINFHSPIYG